MGELNYREEISAAGRTVIEKGLTWGTSGNISMTDEQGNLYITAGGTRLGALSAEDILLCGTASAKKPSKELSMHQAVYARRPDVRAVVHASPFYTTLCASSSIKMESNLFIEAMYYLSRMTVIAYFHAGSAALAEAVGAACEKADVILMRNHGVTVFGPTMQEALCALEVVENTCKMNVLANMGAFSLQPVADETVREFLDGGHYKPRRA